jgi:hypothetical protein
MLIYCARPDLITNGPGDPMGWFLQWQTRRAARQYARLLGPHLSRSYGASEFYSPVQILAGIGRERLNERFVALGYAGFLPEADFAELAPLMPVRIGYGEARSLLARYRPTGGFSSAHHYESGIGTTDSHLGGHHGGSS